MEIRYTDGTNEDFVRLCHELDDFLNDIVGGAKQRLEYNQYNLLDDIHDVVLVVLDHEVIGCGSFKQYDDTTAEVKRVFIKHEYRGLGYAKSLMIALEDRAKEKGYQRLILETGKPLTDAMKLYQRMGYQIIPNYGQYRDMPLSICMEKCVAI